MSVIVFVVPNGTLEKEGRNGRTGSLYTSLPWLNSIIRLTHEHRYSFPLHYIWFGIPWYLTVPVLNGRFHSATGTHVCLLYHPTRNSCQSLSYFKVHISGGLETKTYTHKMFLHSRQVFDKINLSKICIHVGLRLMTVVKIWLFILVYIKCVFYSTERPIGYVLGLSWAGSLGRRDTSSWIVVRSTCAGTDYGRCFDPCKRADPW